MTKRAAIRIPTVSPQQAEERETSAFRTLRRYLGRSHPRTLLANLWLFEPVVIRLLARSPEAAALLRTTTAPTIFEAGVKDR